MVSLPLSHYFLTTTASKVTLFALVGDNLTHYADGFHCNTRSPLQDYAMPFLH